MSFKQQQTQFFLPSLLKHNFEQLYYQNNKFIVYDVDRNKNKHHGSKSVSTLQRPNTEASINNRMTNELINVRNKASIQKFILTHKKINEQRMKPQTSNFLMKKYNRNLIKKGQISRQYNQDNATLNFETQSKKKDELGDSSQDYNIKQNKIESKDKLVKQIGQRQKLFQRKDLRLSTKSVDRGSGRVTEESICYNQDIDTIPVSRQQQGLIYKQKNTSALRGSVIIGPNDIQKITKNLENMIQSPSNNNSPPHMNKVEMSYKQPQIKNKNSLKQNLSDQSLQKINDQLPENSGSISPQDYKQIRPQHKFYKQTNQVCVLPHESFFQSYTSKINTFIGFQGPKFRCRVQPKQDIKCSKQAQGQKEMDTKIQPSRQGTVEKAGQRQSLWKKVVQTIQGSQKEQHKRLSSVQQQQVSKTQRQNQVILDQKKILLTQQIQNLGKQPIHKQRPPSKQIENQGQVQQLENGFPLHLQTCQSGKFSSLKSQSRLSQSKKIVFQSRLRQNKDLLVLARNGLKRANITNFIDKGYYSHLTDLYQALVNQRENASIAQKNKGQDGLELQESSNLKYIKQFHKDRSQLMQFLQQSSLSYKQKQQAKVYVDKQFSHEDIKIPKMKQVHWIYFKPCPQSALFPKKVKLPQHYLMSQQQEVATLPLIPLLNCLLTTNPSIIQRLFQPTYKNVFSCWLNIDNLYKPVCVDGYLPYDGNLNSLYACNDESLWVAVLIKCCAKVLGGYQKMYQLGLDDWARIILGRGINKLEKPTHRQIQDWGQKQFQDNLHQYFSKAQTTNKAYIIVRQTKTDSLHLITSIQNKTIKMNECNPAMLKLQISLYEFFLSDQYELLLFPGAHNLYHSASDYESLQQGNIVTYQLKVSQDKTNVCIYTRLSSCKVQSCSFGRPKRYGHMKRAILIYEVPRSIKKQNNRQMVLKYSSDNFIGTRLLESFEGIQTLEMQILQMKKGHYKIFIQCGQVKLNSLQAYQTNNREQLSTQYSAGEMFDLKLLSKGTNLNYKNVISIVTDNQVLLEGGKSLTSNQNKGRNQVIQYQNFNQISTQMKHSDSNGQF